MLRAVNVRGDGHRGLGPLDADGVRGIAALYAADDVDSVPLESIARASEGVPARIHERMSEWARQEAARRLTAAAEFLAAERRHRRADLAFANNVIGLKLGRIYAVEAKTVDSAPVRRRTRDWRHSRSPTPRSSSGASSWSASSPRGRSGRACSRSSAHPAAGSRP